MQSDSHNLKYLGIDALGRLIKSSPEIAEQHQLAVIDCLEVRDLVSFSFLYFGLWHEGLLNESQYLNHVRIHINPIWVE